MNNIYDQTIRVYTDVDTLYSVTAEKAPGCIVTDTIRISLKKTPAIDLGNDTSFCRGETITLNAGAGYSSYHWNTNATTPVVHINSSGLYWVQVTGGNGCTGTDTIQVSKRACANRIYIPNAFTPNNDRPMMYSNRW